MGGRGSSSGMSGGAAASTNRNSADNMREVVPDKELTELLPRDVRKYVPKGERQEIARDVKQEVDSSLKRPAKDKKSTTNIKGYTVTVNNYSGEYGGYTYTIAKGGQPIGGHFHPGNWSGVKYNVTKQIARNIVSKTAFARQRNA